MSAIVCRDVTKTYAGGVRALGPLDLEVRRGAFVSLLGPSGCGKSTLLRVIAGLEPPTAGSVQVEERGPRRTGFVFQEPTLMPWATVHANVGLPLRLGTPASSVSNDIIDDALARVGLSDFAQAYPRELSGGMKMRASIARALVTSPDILLMDEPFAALDEITRFQLNDDLLALWERSKTTIVFVTHSVFEAVYLSQRVMVMTARPGRIAREFMIDAEGPRNEAFRTSVAYAQTCREVSAALARATIA